MRTVLATALLVVCLGAGARAGAQTPTLPPNELGRVMILEYHKIDQLVHS